jgi:TonB family protein
VLVACTLLSLGAVSVATAATEEPATEWAQLPDENAPEVRVKVSPRYPAEALRNSVQGTVVVRVLIDTLGQVSRAEIERSIPGLDSSAVQAARRWTFHPASVAGRPVPVWVRIPFPFGLDAKSTRYLDFEPLCQPVRELKKYAQLCALREGEHATFVLGLAPRNQIDEAAFGLASFPESCDVELALAPNGFARGRWPCDPNTQRLAVPVSLANGPWLLTRKPVVVRSVTGTPALVGLELPTRELWQNLFGVLPDPLASTSPDPAADDGTFDNETLPEARTRVDPRLSDEARTHRLAGRVVVQTLVDRQGRVAVAYVLEPTAPPELVDASLQAIRDWTFTPGRDGTEPRAMWVAITFEYKGTVE